MDESEADVEIDIHQPVTSDECDTKSDYFGVFPLKGKLLNVKDQTIDKIANNSIELVRE